MLLIFCPCCLQFTQIYIFILHPPPPEQSRTSLNARFFPWRAWLNIEMLVVGGVVVCNLFGPWCWLFAIVYSLHTNWYICILHPLPLRTHPPTLILLWSFLCWRAWLNMEMLLVGGVVVLTQQISTYPPTHTHPTTIQGFFADTNRLTMKSILRLMLAHRKNRRTANAVRTLTH